MIKFEFGNFYSEIDTMDLDFTEKYEECSKALAEAHAAIPKDGKMSDIIRANCVCVFEYFSSLFGEGTDKLMFGDKTNVRICDAALVELANCVKADREAYRQEAAKSADIITGKNRAQRRAAAKQAKK